MSTKIYIGQRSTDANVFTTADRIREVVEPIFAAKFADACKRAEGQEGELWSEVFGLHGRLADDWDIPIKKSRWDTPETVYKLVRKLQDWPMHTFTEDIDFGYTVSLIPDGRDNTLPPLVLLFSEDAGDEYRKALEDAGVVEAFGYWNNVDEPEGMDPKEWEQRKLAWDKLDVPAEGGLQIEQPSRMQAVGNYAFKKIDPLTD